MVLNFKVDNPAMMPDAQKIDYVEEPYVKASIMVPDDYVGSVMELCQRKRGNFITMDYLAFITCQYHLRTSTCRNCL